MLKDSIKKSSLFIQTRDCFNYFSRTGFTTVLLKFFIVYCDGKLHMYFYCRKLQVFFTAFVSEQINMNYVCFFIGSKTKKYIKDKSLAFAKDFMRQLYEQTRCQNQTVYTALLWEEIHTATTRRYNRNPEANIFYFRQVTFLSCSLEEMADMDELFGSDGDSDNDQRGNDTLIFIM